MAKNKQNNKAKNLAALQIDKNLEKLKLEYDLHKTYTFYLFMAIITSSIGYFTTENLVFAFSSIAFTVSFLVSICLMYNKYNKLVKIYSEKTVNDKEISKGDKKTLGLFFAAVILGALLSFIGNMSANFVWNFYAGTLPDKMFYLGLGNLVGFAILVIIMFYLIYKFSKF